MEGGVGAVTEATLRALIEAEYVLIPRDQRPACRDGRKSCGNYFCIPCMVGGLCECTFQEGGDHANHAGIPVWEMPKKKMKTSCSYAVCEGDLRKFMADDMVDQIQLYKYNGRLHCMFFPFGNQYASTAEPSSTRPACRYCTLSLLPNSTPNQSATPACSIKCFLDYGAAQRAKRQRQQNEDNNKTIVRSENPECGPQR